MKKLIIDRSKWRTGGNGSNSTGKGPTLLLNAYGYKCCLGFYCEQAGIDIDLLYKGTPEQILNGGGSEHYDKLRDIVYLSIGDDQYYTSTYLGSKAMCINDTISTTPARKEKLLIEAFATVGTEVEFINDYTR